jgi:hypothetical protein
MTTATAVGGVLADDVSLIAAAAALVGQRKWDGEVDAALLESSGICCAASSLHATPRCEMRPR